MCQIAPPADQILQREERAIVLMNTGVNGESEPGPLAPDVDAFEIFNTACKVGNGFC